MKQTSPKAKVPLGLLYRVAHLIETEMVYSYSPEGYPCYDQTTADIYHQLEDCLIAADPKQHFYGSE